MLYYNTVNEHLIGYLKTLMSSDVFNSFRLVGGTALSLQIGHRTSVDIDLFSDVEYGSIDFKVIEAFLKSEFEYVVPFTNLLPALGKSYSIGTDENNSVKLDVYYTDPFIRPCIIDDGIRLADKEEIIAMKIDVIQRGGRKKDFWDIHELLSAYSIGEMLNLHKLRYPYSHNQILILKNFTDFSIADHDFDPICLQGKYWEFIKEDIENEVQSYRG